MAGPRRGRDAFEDRLPPIGGEPPHIAIREGRHERMIVVRLRSGRELSTGIPAGDMSQEQARRHPEAHAFLWRVTRR